MSKKVIEKPLPQPSGPTWTDKVQAFSSLFTTVIALLGFIFIIVQIHQAKADLNGSTHAAIYAQMHDIDRLFTEKPELRCYFYDNCDVSDCDNNATALLAVSDMFADFFEHISQQKDRLPPEIWPAWKRYMRYVYDNSPVLRRHFEKNSDWYDARFIDFIKNKRDDPPL